MDVPAFMCGEVTDDQLRADLEALETSRYPQWRLAGSAAYETARQIGDRIVVTRFHRIWLDHSAGNPDVPKTVTLRRLDGPGTWQRVETSGHDPS